MIGKFRNVASHITTCQWASPPWNPHRSTIERRNHMRKRNHAVYIRMTTDEFEKLQSKVKQSGLSMQAYIIHAALEGKVSTIEEINILRERSNHLEDIDRQLRGIGTNVNQLAYVANGQGVIPSAIKLAEISHEVTSFRNEVRKNWQLTRRSIHQQRVMEL